MKPFILAAALASGVAIALGGAFADPPPFIDRAWLLAQPIGTRLGGDTTRPLAGPTAFTFMAANAQRSRQRPFFFGNRLFNTNWVQAPASVASFDGLGPTFNRASCSGCHTRDGRGRPPIGPGEPMQSMLVRLSLPGEGPHGGPLPVPGYGDQLNDRAVPGVPPEGRVVMDYQERPGTYPDGTAYSLRHPTYRIVDPAFGPLDDRVLTSPRVAPAVIGLGLLEAVPEDLLRDLADPDDADGDGISGRLNMVWDEARGATVPGRFGWKANQPSLRQQNAAAALGDIGLTTSLYLGANCEPGQDACRKAAALGDPPEMSDVFLDKLTLYTRLLAVPERRGADDPEVVDGERVFREIGCAECHLPTLSSGEVPDLPELANQVFHPFTDLLLHDMGDGLADGRPDFLASGREWRTPPLWGLGLYETVNGHTMLLHDGRARSIEEAILWHGGEAAAAREAFMARPAAERAALIDFLRSL